MTFSKRLSMANGPHYGAGTGGDIPSPPFTRVNDWGMSVSGNGTIITYNIDSNLPANSTYRYEFVNANVEHFPSQDIVGNITVDANGNASISRTLDRFYEYDKATDTVINLRLTDYVANSLIATAPNLVVQAADTFTASGGNLTYITGGVDSLQGGYALHAFTQVDTTESFTVSSLGAYPANVAVEMLIVGPGTDGERSNIFVASGEAGGSGTPSCNVRLGAGGGGGEVTTVNITADNFTTTNALFYYQTVRGQPTAGTNTGTTTKFNSVFVGTPTTLYQANAGTYYNNTVSRTVSFNLFGGYPRTRTVARGLGGVRYGESPVTNSVCNTPGTGLDNATWPYNGIHLITSDGTGLGEDVYMRGGIGQDGTLNTITGENVYYGAGGAAGSKLRSFSYTEVPDDYPFVGAVDWKWDVNYGQGGDTGGADGGSGSLFTSGTYLAPASATNFTGSGGGGGGTRSSDMGATTIPGGSGSEGVVYIRYLKQYRQLTV